MAARLSPNNDALVLLCDALPTGAILVVLITVLGPISGAHFNPIVSGALVWRGEMPWVRCASYTGAQMGGAIVGAWLAHAMFGLPVFQVSTTIRWGLGQWLGEVIATAGLLLTILGCGGREALPYAVGLYIIAAYWFTSSTSFANPAVTLARSLSDTFTGIAPADVPAFIVAQVVGGVMGVGLAGWFFPRKLHRGPIDGN